MALTLDYKGEIIFTAWCANFPLLLGSAGSGWEVPPRVWGLSLAPLTSLPLLLKLEGSHKTHVCKECKVIKYLSPTPGRFLKWAVSKIVPGSQRNQVTLGPWHILWSQNCQVRSQEMCGFTCELCHLLFCGPGLITHPGLMFLQCSNIANKTKQAKHTCKHILNAIKC